MEGFRPRGAEVRLGVGYVTVTAIVELSGAVSGEAFVRTDPF